jgi:hypothetical protein
MGHVLNGRPVHNARWPRPVGKPPTGMVRHRWRLLAVGANICLIALLFPFAVASAAVKRGHKSPRPWWSRTFEPPEVLPAPYPSCCGSYWDTLLLSSTSSGSIVTDPIDNRNHVFVAHTGPNNGRDYADWSYLTQNDVVSHGTEGTSVWIRLRLYFPRDFKPTGYSTGQVDSEWNWLTEFHESSDRSTECSTEDPGTVALGILDSRKNSHQMNPRFRLHLVGGIQSRSRCKPNLTRINGPRLKLGHWYSILEHVVFSPTRKGLTQIWIDGRLMASVHYPTMYKHPDGSVDRYYFCFGYYRLRASWAARVLFDNIAEGPTRASVTRSVRGKN